jgi:hypothetical protein
MRHIVPMNGLRGEWLCGVQICAIYFLGSTDLSPNIHQVRDSTCFISARIECRTLAILLARCDMFENNYVERVDPAGWNE